MHRLRFAEEVMRECTTVLDRMDDDSKASEFSEDVPAPLHYAVARKKRLARHGIARKGVDGRLRSPFLGSSSFCDRTTQKNKAAKPPCKHRKVRFKNRNTILTRVSEQLPGQRS